MPQIHAGHLRSAPTDDRDWSKGPVMNSRTAIPIFIMPLAALTSLASAPAAHAYGGSQDSQYVACVAQAGVGNNNGPQATAGVGEAIASDIQNGVSPQTERAVVRNNAPAITETQVNAIVNCASVYLGGADAGSFQAPMPPQFREEPGTGSYGGLPHTPTFPQGGVSVPDTPGAFGPVRPGPNVQNPDLNPPNSGDQGQFNLLPQ
jgi:hypothetical protein